VFLVSPSTLGGAATQWMELAYAHAFEVPTFVILHRITYAEMRRHEKGVPPLLLASQCTPSSEWKSVVDDVRKKLAGAEPRKK